MRYVTYSLKFIASGLLAGFLIAASALADDAQIMKIVGQGVVTVKQAGGTVATYTAKSGTPITVAEHATVTTDSGAEVYIQVFPGIVATVDRNTEVVIDTLKVNGPKEDAASVREALLDLKKGNIVSQLDPAKKEVNNYKIKTPKGVAAARGTVYSVTVDGQNYVVTTENGSVKIEPAPGTTGSTIVVDAGKVAISGVTNGAQSVSSLAGNASALAAVNKAVTIAAAAVAAVASDPGRYGAESANIAKTQLADTMGTIAKAVPGALKTAAASAAKEAPGLAGDIVTAAINAAAAPGSGVNVADVAKTVTEGAAQGAASTTTTPEQAAAVAKDVANKASNAAAKALPSDQAGDLAKSVSQAAAQGATNGAVSNGQSANNVGTAVASGAAEGASQGASSAQPGAATGIASSAASGAAQGSTNAGATNVDTSTVSGASAQGATAGSNTKVATPQINNPTPAPGGTTTSTPIQTISPDVLISPSKP